MTGPYRDGRNRRRQITCARTGESPAPTEGALAHGPVTVCAIYGQQEIAERADELRSRVTEAQLARHWGVSRRTLQRWRARGYGPAWLAIGGRVLYRRVDVLAFEAAMSGGRVDQADRSPK